MSLASNIIQHNGEFDLVSFTYRMEGASIEFLCDFGDKQTSNRKLSKLLAKVLSGTTYTISSNGNDGEVEIEHDGGRINFSVKSYGSVRGCLSVSLAAEACILALENAISETS
ncbi:hypothetical protein A9K97_gp018 [Tokyovirus A1]|uniref:hypothetical protein n=1 Tax=Tokyovirus A1 TaxID=1826170 RepID=UPI0007A97706|nr:hypothetical protein A9K97_gp018 [Tokyovirus A1]BAU80333.1 hypothetical protein [Tokyovirus A1]